MSAGSEFARVPLEASYAVRQFFHEHGRGFREQGFKLEFIAKESRLNANDTMAALALLIERDEVRVNVGKHGWDWNFIPVLGART